MKCREHHHLLKTANDGFLLKYFWIVWNITGTFTFIRLRMIPFFQETRVYAEIIVFTLFEIWFIVLKLIPDKLK